MLFRALTLDEIVEVTGGALVDGPETVGISGEEAVLSVSTDTRTLQPGALFVALKGENHDGHDYLATAADRGATAFLTTRALPGVVTPHVVVPDTTHAMGDVARYVRDVFPGPVVGVTGSVGKTTVKEMVAHVLTARFSVLKSAANFNNEIGVPQTIFALEATHDALVVEMGMRGKGQIARLAEIAAPTVGVVTGVGFSHIELLGSRDAIADAKAELLQLLPLDTGLAVFPATDPYAALLRSRFGGKILTVSANDAISADVMASNLTPRGNGWQCLITSPWGTTELFIPSPGRFNVQNALLAVAVGGHLNIPLAAMVQKLGEFAPPPMRLERLQMASGVTVFSDAYNAAPDSMVGALETLRDAPVASGGKRIAVLGEMRELGAFSVEGHRLVGQAVARCKPDMLVCVGPLTETISSAARVAGFPADRVHAFATTTEATSILPLIVQPGDVVLVKGSRALAMEQVVSALGAATP